MNRPASLALLAILLGVSPAAAQVATRPIDGRFAAGYAEPGGRGGDAFDSGWNIAGGATFHFAPNSPFGLRFDLGLTRFEATRHHDEALTTVGDSRVEDGYMVIESLSVGASYEFGGRGRFGVSIAAGLAEYSRYRYVNETVLVNRVSCDPLGGVCFGYVAGQATSDSDRLSRPGYDFDLTVAFPLPSRREVYIEGAYHRMESDDAMRYVPIVLGYRW